MSLLSTLQRTAANVLDGVAEKGERAAELAAKKGGNPEKIDETFGRAWEARELAQDLREKAKQNDEREHQESGDDYFCDDATEEASDAPQKIAATSNSQSKRNSGSSRQIALQKRLTRILSEQLGIKEKYITLESSIVDDLGADDMDNLEVMMTLEEDFEIEIPEDDADGFVTVQDVLDYLIKNKDAK